MTFQIIATREFFGPRTESAPLCDYFGSPETFPTRAGAEARIAELDAAPYTTASGESSRPTYTIKAASRR